MPETLQLEQTRINGEIYLLRMFFTRLNEDGKTLDDSKTLYIIEDNIASLNFVDDLMEPLPKLKLMVRDPRGEKLMDYPSDGRTLFFFMLKHVSEEKQNDGSPASQPIVAVITHAFIVDETEVSDMTNDEVFVRVTGVSVHEPLWRSSMSYSWAGSGDGLLKSASKIIEEVMTQADLPIVPTSDTSHSSRKIPFIAPVNSRVGENITYLLDLATTDSDGIYFMPFDWSYEWPVGSKFGAMTGKFELLSLRNMADKDPFSFNAVKIPTFQGFADIAGLARNVQTDSHINASKIMDFNSEVKLLNYSQLDRDWKTDRYSANRVKKYLSPLKFPDSMEARLGKELAMYSTKKPKMRYECSPKEERFMGERMREFSRLSGAIRFTTMGYVKRAPGQIFKVYIDNPITGLYRKFAGTYLISRITHIFKKGVYDQELDLVRCDRISDVAGAMLAGEER